MHWTGGERKQNKLNLYSEIHPMQICDNNVVQHFKFSRYRIINNEFANKSRFFKGGNKIKLFFHINKFLLQ